MNVVVIRKLKKGGREMGKQFINKIMSRKGNLYSLSFLIMIISIIIGTSMVCEAVIAPASYVIYKSGTTYYAQNGQTGANDYSGTVVATVIQSAIDALTNGGKVFIKGDMGTLTTKLTLNSLISLEGEGFSSKLAIDASTPLIEIPNNAYNIIIKNLYLRNYSTAVASRIVYAVGTVNAFIAENNFLVGSNGPITIEGGGDVIIRGNIVQGCRTGIGGRNFYRVVMTGNTFFNATDNPIDVGNIYDADISGNIIYDSQTTPTTQTGIYVDSVMGHLNISDNLIRRVLVNGIQINSVASTADYINITGNQIHYAGMTTGGESGIYLLGTATRNIRNVRIVGNRIGFSGRQGILMEYVQNVLIEGNTIHDNGQVSSTYGYGIRGDEAQEVIIEGNRLFNNTQYGIALFTNSNNYTITGNNVRGNTSGGINPYSGSTRLIKDNLGYNPVGYISPNPSVGASPWTYTNNDGVSEDFRFTTTGGSISDVTKNSQSLGTGGLYHLEPGESIVITYTGTGTAKRWGY